MIPQARGIEITRRLQDFFSAAPSDSRGPTDSGGDMSNLSIQEPLRVLAAALRIHEVIPPAEFEAGLAHLETEVERVALDAHAAQRRGLSLSNAVQDFVNYPQLARLHASIDDILTLSLPPQLFGWVQMLVSTPEAPSFDMMRTAVVAAAADSHHPRRQALARFALFEGVRLNLVLMARWFPDETLGVGLDMDELDKIAEDRVEHWLAEDLALHNDVRPFHVIVAAAVHALNDRADELRAGLALLQRDFFEAVQRRAAVERVLSEMDVRDALLIRNELAPALDEQRFTVEHLQERHTVLGGVSRNALDQRMKRIRAKLKSAPPRRSVALLDLLRESAVRGAR